MTTEAPYSAKPAQYFGNARRDFVDSLPENSSGRLLEVGCGTGVTAAYALSCGKAGWACGLELCEEPAREAMTRLNHVIVGDVETVSLPFPLGHFDALIMSEVLEHLVDPLAALLRLRPYLRPGCVVMAGSPNVAYWRVILTLLAGDWPTEKRGIFDATHLRWFTPKTYRALFEQAGFRVEMIGPAQKLRFKARVLDALLCHRLTYLFHSQIKIRAVWGGQNAV